MTKNKIEVELLGTFGTDRTIAESAWTSSKLHRNQQERPIEDVERVITQMATERHGTPFESVIFRFFIALPTFTDRQVMTHRMQSPNGLSGRYRSLPEDWYPLPEDVIEIMNRFTVLGDIPHGAPMGEVLKGQYDDICRQAFDFYKKTIAYCKEMRDLQNPQMTPEEFKRVRESVRGVIPVCNMTERVSTMNLRSFANFQRQRNSDHAQPEIRFIAQEMLRLVNEANVCPIAIRELQKNGWNI